jgi:hypothetical protein
MATRGEMPFSPERAFYDRLEELLREAEFDRFVEEACMPHLRAAHGEANAAPTSSATKPSFAWLELSF